MILVDTSVWIRFLMNRAPYAEELERILSLNEVAGHEMIYGELLIGDRGGRQRLLGMYEQVRWVTTVPHREVVEFVRARKLHGRGAGWVDVHLLASAVVARVPLWTADASLSALAHEVGAGYRQFG